MNRRDLIRIGAASAAVSAVPTSGNEAAPLPGSIQLTDGKLGAGKLLEAAREIPIQGHCDVIICGGGPAGIAAALAAARRGASVKLLEVHGCLGGVWTAGMLGLILDSGNKGGIMAELLQELEERGGRRGNASAKVTYNPEIMKWTLEELCLAAGVDVRYFTRVVGAVKDGGRLSAVVTESKSGREAWTAKTFIDCTGDGDLGALSGCQFDVGRDEDCACQPMSLMTLITGIEYQAVEPYVNGAGFEKPKDRIRELLNANGVHPSYAKPTLFHLNDGLFALMANHEYGVSAFDPEQMTDATIRARAELHQILAAFRRSGGPWSDVEMVATAEQIGIREGRRIRGRYTVSREDLASGRQHKAGICPVTFPVDVHALTKSVGKTSGYSNEGLRAKPYDIPLPALIAADVDGLMMAGRCISGDFLAHASYRVTGNAVAMGEAAGACSALAAKSGRLPHEVSFEELAS